MLSEEQIFWFDHLTPEQKLKLEELRRELETKGLLVDGLQDAHALLRYLKARQWSVHKAEKMYEAMAAWRAKEGIEALYSKFVFGELPLVQACYPHGYHKTDKWGRPVYIELLGQADVDKLMHVTTMDRFLSYHIQCNEAFRRVKLPACSAAAGRPVLTSVIILDMEGFTLGRHMTVQVKKFLEKVSRVDQDNFPEHLGAMYIINAPWVFRSAWGMVKPFVDAKTLDKIHVLGTHYQAQLLEVIPADNLPERFGGRSVCDLTQEVGPWQDPLWANPQPAPTKAAAAAAAAGGVQLGPGSASALGKQQQLERQESSTSCSSSGLIPAAVDAAGLSSVRTTAGSCHELSSLSLNDMDTAPLNTPGIPAGELVPDGVMVVA